MPASEAPPAMLTLPPWSVAVFRPWASPPIKKRLPPSPPSVTSVLLPVPATTRISPPWPPDALLKPDDKSMWPPEPVSPSPTTSSMEPPDPPVALPVKISTAPDVPWLALPVPTTMSPLTPATPASGVCISTLPLSVAVLRPLVSLKAPPVNNSDVPAVKAMSPPSPYMVLLLKPDGESMWPPEPVSPSPTTASSMEPPDPPTETPPETPMASDDPAVDR